MQNSYFHIERFFKEYFPHYIKYKIAPFHKEWFKLLENKEEKFIEVIGFRGCSKSTIMMLVFPIWGVLTEKFKFPILFADTGMQAKQHIYNLKIELESNKKLIEDFGPFEGQEQWTATNIVLPKYGARIQALSTGQKVRGIRHREFRPDLAAIDDIENTESVRTKEQRDKNEKWLVGEILPALDKEAKTIIIGNLLHSDSLMMRLKKKINNEEMNGIVKEYPFFINNEPAWKDKFPTEKDIENEKKKYSADFTTWPREFLLRIVADEGQEIKEEWIKRYDVIPSNEKVVISAAGVDLAISTKETAHYTAIVGAKVTFFNSKPKIYILSNLVNERLTPMETTERITNYSKWLEESPPPIYVEDVGYQKMQIETLQAKGLNVEGVSVTTDKRARLRNISSYIENGTILFPEKGAEDLIIQLTGFGVEAYDDLVDAFTLLIGQLVKEITAGPQIRMISGKGFYDRP